MSEGEKPTMDKKYAVARQLLAPTQREVGNGAANKHVKQNASARKDFSANSRQASDFSSQYRKPQQTVQQSKNRVFDRRVRGPRESVSNDQKEEVTAGENTAEIGSVEAWGSKKANLNHLLNFHYESRDLYNGSHWKGGPHAHVGKSSIRRGLSRGSAPFNKERFLQANCQFVVQAGKDYAVHASDPDTLVDWDLIEQVCICSHEVPSCPICLYAPIAAKITRCGHIYCWSCILHYLSLDERTWRKCPICFEAVHEKDLKSVTALEKHQYVVGEQMVMKLMKKARGSTLIMPAAVWRPDESFPASVSGSRSSCYAKLLVAEISDVKSIVSKEREELEQQLKEEGESTLEASYVSAALTSLTEREQKLMNIKPMGCKSPADINSPSENSIEKLPMQPSEYDAVLGACNPPKTDHCYLSAFDEILTTELDGSESCVDDDGSSAEKSPVLEATVDDSTSNYSNSVLPADVCEMMEGMVLSSECDLSNDGTNKAANASNSYDPLDANDAFYFYQAADGQHIYMHALNIRCLVKQYGSLRNCPDTVTATVVEMEPVSMDEESRRRLRYLNHLPLTCEFVMAELELKPPVVTQLVLGEFADELEKRHRNRIKRARDDKRRAYCIQREENRKMGIDPTMRIVRSDYVRSSVPLEYCAATASDPPAADVHLGPNQGNDTQANAPSSNRNSRTESTSSQDSVTLPSVPSFAEMLKIGKAKAEAWPARSAQKPFETGASRERSASGGDAGGGEGEDYAMAAPRHHASLSDAIQAALDSYSKDNAASEQHGGGGQAATGASNAATGNKKKKTKKLLFSTGLPPRNG